MYKIIGSDGKEYGPITLAQLKQWLAEGRLNQQSKVLPDGTTDWKTVAELPELASAMPPLTPLPTVPDQTNALRLVKGPAIFILVLAILNVLTSIVSLFLGAFQSQLMNM